MNDVHYRTGSDFACGAQNRKDGSFMSLSNHSTIHPIAVTCAGCLASNAFRTAPPQRLPKVEGGPYRYA